MNFNIQKHSTISGNENTKTEHRIENVKNEEQHLYLA